MPPLGPGSGDVRFGAFATCGSQVSRAHARRRVRAARSHAAVAGRQCVRSVCEAVMMIDRADVMDVRRKEVGGHFHAVRFYDSEPSLCRIVANFLREGLVFGEPAVVIATPEHSRGIIAELRARELDVVALQKNDDLVILDAKETMAKFM